MVKPKLSSIGTPTSSGWRCCTREHMETGCDATGHKDGILFVVARDYRIFCQSSPIDMYLFIPFQNTQWPKFHVFTRSPHAKACLVSSSKLGNVDSR